MKPSSLPFAAIGAALVAVLLLFTFVVVTWRGDVPPEPSVSEAAATVSPAAVPTGTPVEPVDSAPTSTFEGFPAEPDASLGGVPAVGGDDEIGVSFDGTCTAASGSLSATGRGFTGGERYELTVLQPDGSYWPDASGARVDRDGSFGWEWDCSGTRPGLWTAIFTDAASDRLVTAAFTVSATG